MTAGESPRLSIALATYNGARFLPELLESLLSQSLPATEIVVADDVSTDGTRAILDQYARQHPVLRVTGNAKNLGFVRNFEQVIRACSGDIIFLCDQDDRWFPHKLQFMAQALASDPLAGLVVCNADLVSATGAALGRTVYAEVAMRGPEALRKFVRGGRELPIGCTMGFRREYLPLLLPFPATLSWGHDHWIALLLAAMAPVTYLPTPLMTYRRHGQSSGSSPWLDAALIPKVRRCFRNLSVEAYAADARRWQSLLERLGEEPLRLADARLQAAFALEGYALLKGVRDFYADRSVMRAATRREQCSRIRQLYAGGAYHGYARGWRTLLKDLLCLAIPADHGR